MWPIIRDAFRDASPQIRSQIQWVGLFWAAMVMLQIWDSADGRGVSGLAEFLSALLATSGAALLGVAYGLQRTLDDSAGRGRPAGEQAAVDQVLIALPALGFASGVALGGATMLMLVRLLLGTEWQLAIAGFAAYSFLIVIAARTVLDSSRTLFRHATANAAAAATARGEATAAQLAALQARLNPHFLFNALNTVAALVRTNPPAAERVVENLSDVLRATLQRTAATTGTVKDEVAYVRAYLALEQERWGGRLSVSWNVAEEALDLALPPLLLQPLVENALRHGLGGRLEGGSVRIDVTLENGELLMRVTDDGVGFPQTWREGTGLSSVRRRLESAYGPAARMSLGQGGRGASVAVRLPARPATDPCAS
jgi:two-component system sensor histidine kinase AlgZ